MGFWLSYKLQPFIVLIQLLMILSIFLIVFTFIQIIRLISCSLLFQSFPSRCDYASILNGLSFFQLFFCRWRAINRKVSLQLIKCRKVMKDNSDIPLPMDQLRSRVLVFAITDEATHEYQEITKGYVQLSTDEDGNNHTFHYLQVKDQRTNEVLMRSNLKKQNNFGKQKGSIISWTDNEQPQYQQIALSFQKDRQCDMFWRMICEKIGKSYLQINGMQKVQTPTVNNLNTILEKAKNSIDLMDYNIVHSGVIMDGLRVLFYEMKTNGDEFGMGVIYRIINAIMSPTYSSNAIQNLLTKDNFYLLLDIQQFRKSIPFRSIYQKKVAQYLNNKFCLPREVFEKIQLSHRAVFYRENVLELSEDGLLESLMFVVAKEAQVEIVSYLNRTRFLDTLVAYQDYPQIKNDEQQPKQNDNDSKHVNSTNLTSDKLQFLHQAIIIQNQVTGQQLKQTFKQNLYHFWVIPFIKQQIDLLNPKALEILFAISEMDKFRFFEYLIENFKLNSTDNLLKSLMKVYLNSLEMRGSVVALIQALVPLFNLKKELLDFFIGTFVCSVFSVAKDIRAVLILGNILLSHLQNSSILMPQLIKLKICQKLSHQYRTGTELKSKQYQLQLMKFLKYILIQQDHKGISKNKQIQKTLIDSGFLQCCMMIYMKHSLRYNIISSSMMENLRIVQRMETPEIHAFIVKEYVENQTFNPSKTLKENQATDGNQAVDGNQISKSNQVMIKILAPIKTKYLEHLNKKMQVQNDDQDYLQLQRIVHQQILQNQHQDTYLMGEDYEQPSFPKNPKLTIHPYQFNYNSLNTPQNHTVQNHAAHNYTSQNYTSHNYTSQNHPNNNSNNDSTTQYPVKQDSLIFLKRMMDQIKEDYEGPLQTEPRKIVKRSQDSQKTAIDFCFDLPDMDQIIAPQELQGT